MAVADDSYVAVPPLLVVEGASPTTRDLDGDRKLRAYGQADVAWYWIVERAVVVVPPASDNRLRRTTHRRT